jgi:serine/threonine protein kinase
MNQTHDKQFVRAIHRQWRNGEPPDTLAALSDHPALGEDPSLVFDLAYEEFCLRRNAGETVDVEEFCTRFPESCRSFIQRMLLADQEIGYHPSVLTEEPSPPPPKVDWPKPGEELCGCRLLRVLGEGSFARVYLATEASTGERPVALKVSNWKSSEACTLGRLHHNHVVPVLWARRDEARNLNVVCMPFFGSATLLDVCDRLYPQEDSAPPARARAILEAIGQTARPSDPPPDCSLPGPDLQKLSFGEGVARLGRQLAEALAFLHEQHLYHCDLKPPNVLLTAEGRPLLLDFNLSRRGDEMLGLVGGTFAYMAPEHLQAYLTRKPLNDEQAGRADLFALGVMLYELLTGKFPFALARAIDPREIAQGLLESQKQGFPPVRRLNPTVSRRLARVVESCLSVDPAGRPASARQLAVQLRPRRRPRLLVGVAAALVLVAVAGASWLAARPASPESPQQVSPVSPGSPHQVRTSESPTDLSKKARERIRSAIVLQREGKGSEAQLRLTEANDLLTEAIDAFKKLHGGRWGHWEDHFRKCRIEVLLREPHKHPKPGLVLTQAVAYFLDSCEAYDAQGGDPCRAGVSRAYGSYCLALAARHREAIDHGKQALTFGNPSVLLLNNLGFSAMQARNLPRAKAWLDTAQRKDPALQTVYWNRAQLMLIASGLQRRQRSGWMLNVPQVLKWGFEDIEQAIERGRQTGRQESADLYLLAARLFAQAATSSESAGHPGLKSKCQYYLKRACNLGTDTTHLPKDVLLKNALGPLSAKDLPLPRHAPISTPTLLDPLPDDYD